MGIRLRLGCHTRALPFRFATVGAGCGHLCVEVEQFLKPLRIVFEAATDVDTLQNLIVALMCMTQVLGHIVWFVEVGQS